MNGKRFEGLRLSSEEIAELTERLFGRRDPDRYEPGLPIESCLSLFEDEHIPEEAIRAAVEEVVSRREQRLSSVLERKANELERMLLGLLNRLDESFSIEIEAGSAETGSNGRRHEGSVRLQVRARRVELEMRALEISRDGARHLFTILVQGARPAGLFERIAGRKRMLPPRVVVLEPSGLTLRSLLSMSISQADGAPNGGRAIGVAFERLHDAVLSELDGALSFVRQLRFDADGD